MIRVLVRAKGGNRNLLLYYVCPDTRREVSRSADTRDPKEALKAAARWEDELRKYRGLDNDGWQHFRFRFENEHCAALAPKSLASYVCALNSFERLRNPASVADITHSALSDFQSQLAGEGKPLSTISTYLGHIRAAVNWAKHIGMIETAPRVKMPRQPKHAFMRGRPITDPEYRKMLKACSSACGKNAPAWRRMLEFLWLSGLRLSEAMIASWDSPPIWADLQASPYPQFLFYAEGHKARRDDAVPMTPDLVAWLKTTPARQRHGLIAPIPLETMPRASEMILSIGEAAGVIVNDADKFASAHDFRRAFGTRWAKRVMPLTLQKLMRHASLTTTLRYYIGISADDAGREIWGAVPNKVPKQDPRRSTRPKR